MASTSTRLRANNAQINEILGNVPGPQTHQVSVRGVNPVTITCDDICIRDRMTFYGRMATPFTAIGGDLSHAGIRFTTGHANTGLYSPDVDKFCAIVAGVPVTCFTTTGMAVQNIYSPTGIINFGGSTLTNFTMTPNSNAYTLVGTQVQTPANGTVNSLTVPLICPVGANAWELISKTEYTVDTGTGSQQNGVYTFHLRAWNTAAGPLSINAQFDITKHHTPAFVGTQVKAVVVGSNVEIQVTGNASVINWLTKCDVIKVGATS